MEQEIDSTNITNMIRHWLATKENVYLGSSYGTPSTIFKILQEPYSKSAAQSLIQKICIDIPLLDKRNISLLWTPGVNELIVIIDENSTIYALSNDV
ncbi:MAG: hypothetical protein WCS87_20115 [Methylococcaceae bacterium]